MKKYVFALLIALATPTSVFAGPSYVCRHLDSKLVLKINGDETLSVDGEEVRGGYHRDNTVDPQPGFCGYRGKLGGKLAHWVRLSTLQLEESLVDGRISGHMLIDAEPYSCRMLMLNVIE